MRHGWYTLRRWGVGVIFALLLASPHACAWTVDVPDEAVVGVDPGSFVALRVIVDNPAAAPIEVNVAYDAPSHLQLVAPPSTLVVPRNGRRALSMSGRVDPDAPVGPSAVRVTVADANGRTRDVRVTYEVAPVERASIRVERAPRGPVRGPFDLTVRVSNEGNERCSYRVTVVGAAGADVRADPEIVDLAPGESESMDLRLTPDPEGTVPLDLRIRTYVVNAETERRMGRAEAKVRVLPSGGVRTRDDVRHTLPVRMSWSSTLQSGAARATPDREFDLEADDVQVRVSGPLRDGGDVEIRVAATLPSDGGRPRFRAAYEGANTYAIDLPGGTRVAPLTTRLSGYGGHVGFDTGSSHRRWSWRAALYAGEAGPELGVSMATRVTPSTAAPTTVRGRLGASWQPGRLFVSFAPALDIDAVTPLRLSSVAGLRAVEDSVAWQGRMQAEWDPGGVRLRSDVQWGLPKAGVASRDTSLRAEIRRTFSVPGSQDLGARARLRWAEEARRSGASTTVEARDVQVSVHAHRAETHAIATWSRAWEPLEGHRGGSRGETSWQVTGNVPVNAYDVRFGVAYDVSEVGSRVTDARVRSYAQLNDVEIGNLDRLAVRGTLGRDVSTSPCPPSCANAVDWSVALSWDRPSFLGALTLEGGRARTGQSDAIGYRLNGAFTPWRGVRTAAFVEGVRVAPDRYGVEVDGRFTTAVGTLETGVSATRRTVQRPSIDATAYLRWAYTIDVPIGYRADVGRIGGRVDGIEGTRADGLRVRVGSRSASVDQDGTFRFDGVAPGPATLFVDPTTVPEGVLVAPDPVQDLVISPGDLTTASFQLVRAASLDGTLRYVDPSERRSGDAQRDVVYGTGNPEADARIVAGRTLRLESEGRSYETQSSADGTFSFSNLYPGRYRLAIVNDGALRFFDVEPSSADVVIESGANTEIQWEVVPKRRVVEIEDRPGLSIP